MSGGRIRGLSLLLGPAALLALACAPETIDGGDQGTSSGDSDATGESEGSGADGDPGTTSAGSFGTSEGSGSTSLPEFTESGDATVCLGGEEGFYPEELQDISGTVMDQRAPTGSEDFDEFCHEERVDHVLEIEDAEGARWLLGYGVQNLAGESIMPAVDVEMGAQVEARVGFVLGFGSTSAYILRDDEGLVAFVEGGTWGWALGRDAAPEIQITQGPDVGTSEGCSTHIHYVLEFESDTRVVLAPGEQDVLVVGARDLEAYNVTSFGLGEDGCDDEAGAESWAIWRSAG